MIRKLGWVSLGVGVATVGIYLGAELRKRYRFKRRTPNDFYAHSGDEYNGLEYGVGI